jgi:hypothetical protein
LLLAQAVSNGDFVNFVSPQVAVSKSLCFNIASSLFVAARVLETENLGVSVLKKSVLGELSALS